MAASPEVLKWFWELSATKKGIFSSLDALDHEK